MNSDTRTTYGSGCVERHGYARASARNQARSASRAPGSGLALCAGGAMVAIREVMSTDLVAVPPSATVAEAATVMSTQQVGAALVLEADRLLGIFTERDI